MNKNTTSEEWDDCTQGRNEVECEEEFDEINPE
jgi:hypothetical protein